MHRVPQKILLSITRKFSQMRIQFFMSKTHSENAVNRTPLLKSSDITDGMSEQDQLVSKSENINDRHLVLFFEMLLHPQDLHGICYILETINLGKWKLLIHWPFH